MTGSADGRVIIDLNVRDEQAQGAVQGMGGRFVGLAKKVAAAFAIKKIAGWGKELALQANQARQIEQQFTQTFGNSSQVAQANIDRIASNLGMLPGRVQPTFTKFNQSWLMAGKSMEESMSISESMINIAADAAAAFGMSFDDASGALQSFMKGNTQAGLALRINTSQVEIQQWALEHLGLAWEDLDEAQRKVARMQFVEYMYENGRITGMAANASRDYYNVLGNLQQAWFELKAALGDRILDVVIDGMIWLTNVILGLIDFIPVFIAGLDRMFSILQSLTPVIAGVVAGFIAFKVITTLATMIKNASTAMQVAHFAAGKLTIATKAQTAATMKKTGITKAATVAQLANKGAVTLGTLAIGVLTGKIKLATASQALWNGLVQKFPIIQKVATAAKLGFNVVIAAGNVLLQAALFPLQAMGAATLALGKKIKTSTIAKKAWNAILGVSSAVTKTKTVATTGLGTAVVGVTAKSKLATAAQTIWNGVLKVGKALIIAKNAVLTTLGNAFVWVTTKSKLATASQTIWNGILKVSKALNTAKVATLKALGNAYVWLTTKSKLAVAAKKAWKLAVTMTNAVIKTSTIVMKTLSDAYIFLTKKSKLAVAAKKIWTLAVKTGNYAIKLATSLTTGLGTAMVAFAKKSKLAMAAIKLVTAAKKILNAVLLANPIGLVVAAIGLLVAGVVGLVKWFGRGSEESRQLNSDIETLNEAIEAQTEALTASEAAFQDNLRSIDVNEEANRRLAQSVIELAAEEDKSIAQRAVLNGQLGELSEALGGVILYYDEEAGALNMSNDQLEERIRLMAEQERKNEGLARQQQLMQEIIETEMKREETLALIERAIDVYGENSRQVRELRETYTELEGSLEELGVRKEVTAGIVAASADEIARASAASAEEVVLSYETMSDAQRSVVDEMVERWQQYASMSREMFSELSHDTKMYTEVVDESGNRVQKSLRETGATSEEVVQQMIDNLRANQEATEEWSNNLVRLAELTCEGFADEWRQLGPGVALYVQDMLNVTEDQLGELHDIHLDGGNVATTAMANELGDGYEEVLGIVAELGEGIGDTLSDRLEAADFPGMGQAVGEGTATGIDESADKAIDAAKTMSDNLLKGMKTKLGISSPSRITKEYGRNLTEGLAQGIDEGEGLVSAAMQRLSQTIKESTRNIKEEATSAFKNIGQNMGQAIGQMQQQATSQLSGLTNTFRSSFQGIQQGVKSSISGINSAVSSGFSNIVSTAQSSLSNLSTTISSSFQGISQTVKSSITNINSAMSSGFSNITSTAQSSLSSLSTAFSSSFQSITQNVTSSISNINSTISNGFSNISSTAQSSLSNLSATFSSSFQSITQNVSSSISNINSTISSGFSNITSTAQSSLSSLSSTFTSSFQNITQNVTSSINSINSTISSGFSNITSTAQSSLNSLSSTFTSSFQNIVSNVNSSISSINSTISSGFSNITSTAQSSLSNLSSTFNSNFQSITQNVTSSITNINSTFTTGFSNMVTTSQTGLTNIASSFSTQFANIQTQTQMTTNNIVVAFQTAMSNILTAVQQGMWNVLSAVQNVNTTLINEMNTLQSKFMTAGANAMQGLAAGINNNRHVAVNAARATAQAVAAEMQSALEISSPSRLMRDEVGRPIIDGIAVGMERNVDRIRDTVKSLLNVLTFDPPDLQTSTTRRQQLQFALPQVSAEALVSVRPSEATLTSRERSASQSTNSQQKEEKVTLELPVILDGREVSRIVTPYVDQMLKSKTDNKLRARGAW